MSRRAELAIIAYTLALVLFSLVQAIHNQHDTEAVAPMIAAGASR